MADRLISADRFKAYMLEKYLLYDNTLEDIDAQPTVDAEPVRHGRWEDSSNGWMCSECFKEMHRDYPFCPNCGAKMDESTMGQVKPNEGDRREDGR